MQILKDIFAKIGMAVLLAVPYGTKKAIDDEWQKLTIEQTQTPEYAARFERQCNIGVSLGTPSNGLCTLDLDRDQDIEPFLSLNPALANTFRTVGARGCNLWFRVIGEYPPLPKPERFS